MYTHTHEKKKKSSPQKGKHDAVSIMTMRLVAELHTFIRCRSSKAASLFLAGGRKQSDKTSCFLERGFFYSFIRQHQSLVSISQTRHLKIIVTKLHAENLKD